MCELEEESVEGSVKGLGPAHSALYGTFFIYPVHIVIKRCNFSQRTAFSEQKPRLYLIVQTPTHRHPYRAVKGDSECESYGALKSFCVRLTYIDQFTKKDNPTSL